MKSESPNLAGPFADEMTAFLKYKRQLRKSYLTEEFDLRLFDRYLHQQEITEKQQVTNIVVEAFLNSRPRKTSRSYNSLLGALRRFFAWLVMQEILSQSPVCIQPRRRGIARRPFILSCAQVEQLLNAAVNLRTTKHAPRRGHTYKMIFALLFTLGLRVSEVTNLKIKDVDLERHLLIIRETKFLKSRLVPFGPNLAERLVTYIAFCCANGRTPEQPLFSFDPKRNRPVARGSIGSTFRRLLPCLNLQLRPGDNRPRLHDLRHSMAVGTLLRWYREGKDPSNLLIQLSTYLGHSDISSTAVYLEMTEELLHVAGQRFEQFASPLIGGKNT